MGDAGRPAADLQGNIPVDFVRVLNRYRVRKVVAGCEKCDVYCMRSSDGLTEASEVGRLVQHWILRVRNLEDERVRDDSLRAA